ncbi:MAG: hypothetical protein FWG66_00585, partial [Spirochaetes bacterium]|nr:hypothetical protein [Spirochaetota bacterium]
MLNEKILKPAAFLAAGALHVAAIFSVAMNPGGDVAREAPERAPVMRLANIAEIPLLPPAPPAQAPPPPWQRRLLR